MGLFRSLAGMAMKHHGRVLTDEAAAFAGKRNDGHALARDHEIAPRMWVKQYESRVGGEPLIVITEGTLLRDTPRC